MGVCCSGLKELNTKNLNEIQALSSIFDKETQLNNSMYLTNIVEVPHNPNLKDAPITEAIDTIRTWKTIDKQEEHQLSTLKKIYPSNAISSITIEELWNITKHYNNDFTSSKYILYDLREKEHKTENFIKSYKCINYTIDKMSHFTKDKFNILNRFLLNKLWIIIPKDDNLNEVSKWIGLFNYNKIKWIQYWILGERLCQEALSHVSFQLYQHLDHNSFYTYPFIWFPLSKLNYFHNSNYIFLDEKPYHPLFTNEHPSLPVANKDSCINKNTSVWKGIESFIEVFNVHVVICLINNSNEYTKTKKGNVNYLTIGMKISENALNLRNFLNFVHAHVLISSSLLFLVHNLKGDVIDGWSSIWSYVLKKISYITSPPINTNQDLVDICHSVNLVYLPGNFTTRLKRDLDVIDTENKLRQSLCLDALCKERIEKTVMKLYNEINWNIEQWQAVVLTMERIILNVWIHPKDERYYKIRKTSSTFSQYIERYSGAKELWADLGFQTDGQNMNFYYLNKNCDWNILHEMNDVLMEHIKKLLEKL